MARLSAHCRWVLSSRPFPQPFVTELDLRIAQLPDSVIGYLRQAIPSTYNAAGEPEYDYGTWIDSTFG